MTELALDPNDPGVLPAYPNYPDSGVTTVSLLATALVDSAKGVDVFDEDLDTDTTELRDWLLGDIFHALPKLVGPPVRSFLKEEGRDYYPSGTPFVEQYATRDRIIYVGANDAMLHAFHAGDFVTGDNPNTSVVETDHYTLGTGEELFAYVPRLLHAKLKEIPLNVPRSSFFVDGPSVAADVWLPDPNDPNDVSKEPDEWTTVLMTGFRQGGPGYVAFDVTDPTATSGPHGPYPKLLGEFTHANLGDSWSVPVITRVKTRANTGVGDHCGKDDGDGDCRERWVAIFGAGYRPDGDPASIAYVPDPTDASWSDASKAIVMVALDSGDVIGVVAFDASGVDGPAEMKYSIPSAPAVLDLDFDGFVDVVYIGDTGGQMWKWDISVVAEDSDADGEYDNWSYGVFFRTDPTALSGGNTHYRSFYYPPAASFVDGELYLAFGSGERNDLHYAGDSTKDDNNRFFVVHDPNPTGGSAFPGTLTETKTADCMWRGGGDSRRAGRSGPPPPPPKGSRYRPPRPPPCSCPP